MNFLRRLVGYPEDNSATLNTTLPSVATTAGAKKMLGTAPEKKGHTMAGGKRMTYRRKSHKKTHRRRKHH
jgi:hypothetical protein